MNPITVTLSLGKETPGTYRYENAEIGSLIPTLYVKKAAFSGKPPGSITLTVEVAK